MLLTTKMLGEHKTPDCPIYNGPKSHAVFCCLASSKLGFFKISMEGPPGKAPKRENATALISAKVGVVTVDLIKSEVARLVSNSNGPPRHMARVFLAKWTCRAWLATRYIHTQNGDGIMKVEEWEDKIQPQELLKKAWVNIYGAPYEIQSFLPLWAIGTVLEEPR
jgi:hypothetical protein